MADRIKRRPDQLRDQLNQGASGITGAGAAWTGSPTAAQATTAATNIDSANTIEKNAAATLKIARKNLRTARDAGLAVMKKIDETSDSVYGPAAAEKANFGLLPKGGSGGGPEPLHKLIEILTKEGLTSGSIFFDWESIDGASYEIKWYSNGTLTQLVGSATSTASEYMISGLTPGQQYWMIVRPVRASEQGPWSDPATRVANV